jgi:hypothetical protein
MSKNKKRSKPNYDAITDAARSGDDRKVAKAIKDADDAHYGKKRRKVEQAQLRLAEAVLKALLEYTPEEQAIIDNDRKRRRQTANKGKFFKNTAAKSNPVLGPYAQ